MKEWEEVIANFLEDYHNGLVFEEQDLEEFIEGGLKMLLTEHMALKKASEDLVESNLKIFKQILTKPNLKMQHSQLYQAISDVMSIITDQSKIQ